MFYIIALVTCLFIVGTYFLVDKFFPKMKELLLNKMIPCVLILIFTIRIFCYKSIIANSPNNFWGLDASLLEDKVLSAFCLIFIWAQYTSVLFVICKGFFKIKLIENITKYIAPFFLLMTIIFVSSISIMLQGTMENLLLPIFLSIESGWALGICVYSYFNTSNKITFKEFGWMLLTFLGLSLATLPSYFVQFMFGYQVGTNAIVINDFNPYHRIVLYGAIIIPVALYFVLHKKDPEFTRFVLIYITCATMVGFLVNYSYESLSEPWRWPFHLCNTAMFIIPLTLIFKLKGLFYFTYFINVVGAVIAMLMPNYADGTNIMSMRMFNFWYNHYIASFMPLLIVALKVFERPKLKQFIQSMGAFLVYFLLALFLNVLFTAKGHDVDYFFLNGDYVVDKLGTWAEKLYDIKWTVHAFKEDLLFHPAYQIAFFVVYIFIGLAIWFVYEEAYRFADSHFELAHRIKKIRLDEYALKSALNGRKLSEPMEKDCGIKYELRHFSKKYATSNVYAVKDANFEIHGGEIFGFLGPNGAGKSTIIKTTVGIQPLSEGNIMICGYDVATQPVEAKSQIGYVPDHYALYEKLTGREYVNYIADIYNVSKKDRDERIEKYVKLFQLENSFDSMIKTYSHGMKQKITIMSALIHNPKIWILDEPLTGLDPNSIYQVKECMKDHAAHGNIVFFSSHLIDIVEKLCQRIAIIKKGQILCVKTLEEIEATGMTLEEFYLKTIGEELK